MAIRTRRFCFDPLDLSGPPLPPATGVTTAAVVTTRHHTQPQHGQPGCWNAFVLRVGTYRLTSPFLSWIGICCTRPFTRSARFLCAPFVWALRTLSRRDGCDLVSSDAVTTAGQPCASAVDIRLRKYGRGRHCTGNNTSDRDGDTTRCVCNRGHPA
jgi:hypothetical protein